ncbi:MAG: 4Fe-4S dicluster domain-containing protein [Lachnospiraceae bacterium]
MRGIDTEVRKDRKDVFKAIAKLAYESTDIKADMEALPYKLVEHEGSERWENVYREREVARERIRLAMGMSLRPEDTPVSVSDGIELSDIAEKYYEPPLLQVIPSACNACKERAFEVSNHCMGCVAHPCMEVCPVSAITMRKGKSYIDQSKCIKCGKCKAVCPYDAITKWERPCAKACGVQAIKSDESGRAVIDPEICVTCGMCMVSCPFGAIADKSQIFQLIRAFESGKKVIAQIAPAFTGQFGPNVTVGMLTSGLKALGFSEVFETALGADIGCLHEAEHYVEQVASGKQAFSLTSCCPSWSVLARRYFPETIENISNELTPMVATARIIKQKHPDAAVVFIGPCVSKKLEAARRTVRSDVDFVITFEELLAMFEAKDIELTDMPHDDLLEEASSLGRGYGASGGVSGAIKRAIDQYYPGTSVKIEQVNGLTECKKALLLAKNGKLNGCLIEGMACPGGCVAGAGTNTSVLVATREINKFAKSSTVAIPKM